jgi:hypothetical protein
LPALYPAAAAGLPTLTDKGYTGAGIGIQVPLKGDKLATGNQARIAMINALASTPPDHTRPLENRSNHRRRTRPTPTSKTHPVRKPHFNPDPIPEEVVGQLRSMIHLLKKYG